MSARDYVAARVKDTWHRQKLVFSLAYLFIALCFFFYVFSAIVGEELGRALNAVMAGLILACIIVVERAYYWAQYAAYRESFVGQIERRVMEGGLLVSTPDSLTVQRYSFLLKWVHPVPPASHYDSFCCLFSFLGTQHQPRKIGNP